MVLHVHGRPRRRVATRSSVACGTVGARVKLRPALRLTIVILRGVAAAVIHGIGLCRMRQRAWLQHDSALLLDLLGAVTKGTMSLPHVLLLLIVDSSHGHGAVRIERLERLRLESVRLQLMHAFLAHTKLLSGLTQLVLQ